MLRVIRVERVFRVLGTLRARMARETPAAGHGKFPKLQNLTFFYADFGKEFPSRTLWRGPPSNCPSRSSVLCPLLYRTEYFSRWSKGWQGAEKRRGRGVASKGGKKEKRTRENRSGIETNPEQRRKKRTQPPPKENLLENFSGLKEKLSRPVVDTKTLWKPGKPYPPSQSFLCGPHFVCKEKFCTGAGRCTFSFSQQKPSPKDPAVLKILRRIKSLSTYT